MSASPLRVAVVGSGPAGFYAAGALLKSEDPPVEVDLLERLPTPWGLVRLGVAPDHREIKAVSRAFEKIAARPGFRFFGNVEVGRDRHATTTSLGSTTPSSTPSAPRPTGGWASRARTCPGSWPATEFVAWYNGHPDFQDLGFDLSGERAVVVGNGNVAIDVRAHARADAGGARADGHDRRGDRGDLSAPASEEIVMLGRRGPVQAAFTTAGAEGARRARRRRRDRRSGRPRARRRPARHALEEDRERAQAQRRAAARVRRARADRQAAPRSVLRFLVSPVAILGDGPRRGGRGRPQRARRRRDGRIVAGPTGETRGDSVRPRAPERRLPRRPAARRPVRRAARHDPERRRPGRRARERTYCAGWIKRGPSGVIGTNKKDATETVELLLEDARAGKPRTSLATRRPRGSCWPSSGVDLVDYEGWQAIDAAERGAASRSAARGSSSRPGTSSCKRAEESPARGTRLGASGRGAGLLPWSSVSTAASAASSRA